MVTSISVEIVDLIQQAQNGLRELLIVLVYFVFEAYRFLGFQISMNVELLLRILNEQLNGLDITTFKEDSVYEDSVKNNEEMENAELKNIELYEFK